MKWLIHKVLPVGILLGLAFAFPDNLAVHLYPVIISLSFAASLGWSLLYPPSLIERFARLTEPNLDARGVKYTRKVTIVWLVFCLLNAAISLATSLWHNHALWLWYNGFISYILIGLLMAGEYIFRRYYKAKGKKGMQAFTPAHMLLAARDREYWKAYWNAPELDAFPDYVSALAAKIKESNAKRIFVIHEDRAHFLAGCLAGFYANVPVVLPQSDSPELLKDLLQPGDIFFTDLLNLNIIESPCAPLDPESSMVIFYTSGSTGKPKAIEKKLSQLEAEVEVLHHLWSQSSQGCFLSTVSHHHLYAFLYSVLWPVCSGCRIERKTFTYWGDLLGKSQPGDFLISSPAHLGRFSVLSECPPAHFGHAFSSGAPLAYEAAIESKKYLGLLPIEVYGSTETGGIAFRQQEQPSTPWRRFDCVELSNGPENKLRVKSPYIDGHYQTEDLIEWVNADSFHLLGRADRVVKVEGKRVSLSEIENQLRKSPLVTDAAALVLDKSYRDELGAVIVLSKQGIEKLQNIGKAALTRHLRKALSFYFHAVVLPRKWRFIDAIPVNPQGKHLRSSLKNLFEKREKPPLGPVRKPIILNKEVSVNKAGYALKIPPDLAYLEGHFKNTPIVPGIVQLHWAVELAQADLRVEGNVTQGNQIKFTNLMHPDDEVSLLLEYNRDKSSVTYSYKKGELPYSSGRITFTAGAADGV